MDGGSGLGARLASGVFNGVGATDETGVFPPLPLPRPAGVVAPLGARDRMPAAGLGIAALGGSGDDGMEAIKPAPGVAGLDAGDLRGFNGDARNSGLGSELCRGDPGAEGALLA